MTFGSEEYKKHKEYVHTKITFYSLIMKVGFDLHSPYFAQDIQSVSLSRHDTLVVILNDSFISHNIFLFIFQIYYKINHRLYELFNSVFFKIALWQCQITLRRVRYSVTPLFRLVSPNSLKNGLSIVDLNEKK